MIKTFITIHAESNRRSPCPKVTPSVPAGIDLDSSIYPLRLTQSSPNKPDSPALTDAALILWVISASLLHVTRLLHRDPSIPAAGEPIVTFLEQSVNRLTRDLG